MEREQLRPKMTKYGEDVCIEKMEAGAKRTKGDHVGRGPDRDAFRINKEFGVDHPLHKVWPSPFEIMDPETKGDSRPYTVAHGEPYEWTFGDVPTLPDMYPLELTAVFVPHADALLVGRRIANALRRLSIPTKFDDKKAKAKCVAKYGVDFRVRLYRGKGKFCHGIIAEVQRRFGFSTRFAADARAILDAAEGKEVFVVPAGSSSLLPPPQIPMVSDDEDDDEDCMEGPSSPAKKKRKACAGSLSLLNIASEVLFKRTKATQDAKELALEGLESLTDPDKVGRSAALRASRQILTNSDVRDGIVSLLVLRGEEVSGSDESDLRRRAATVLSNAASTLASA